MARRLITKSDFARLAGCQPSTVTRAATKALAAAVVVDRIDANHPVALAWADRQRRRQRR
jgi:hypothetical protein